MTPQERQLIAELFDRLASLENAPRDPDAEALIREGFRRAPNAAYALVQTVLVQDEALKAANNRIQQFEQAYATAQPEQPRGFLDSMRGSLFGREEPRGSVPRVPQGGAPSGALTGTGAPAGYGDPWNRGAAYQTSQGAPMMQPPAPQGGGGGSFLGTAAAAAAGVIGGSLLMSGIRSAMAGHQGGPASKAFEDFGSGGDRAPSGGGGGGDLAREAGLNDIRGGAGSSGGDYARPASLLDTASSESEDDGEYEEGGDAELDGGDTEEV